MLAFSKEWIDALAEILKKDEIYQKKASGFDSSYQFVVQADPKKGIPADLACGLNLPQCDQTWIGIRKNTDYDMTAPIAVFHKIIRGKLGAVLAITTRKARIQGNLARLLKYNGAINRFNQILQEIKTEFPGDYE